MDFLELDVFTVVIVEDLFLFFALAVVDNRYTTIRSCSAGSGVLSTSLRFSFAASALEVVLVEKILSTLLALIANVILTTELLAARVDDFLLYLLNVPDAFVHKAENHCYNDGDTNEDKKYDGNESFQHNVDGF